MKNKNNKSEFRHIDQSIDKNIELLAPVGRWDVLEAVLDAGADAVYLAGKDYNMRRHRSDFNFDPDQIARAADIVHATGAKIYVTMNILLSDRELMRVENDLRRLASVGVDAIIVNDLGLIHVANRLNTGLALHASTMMNIHSPEGASACAEMGIDRVICSRDVTLNQVKEMAEVSGLEMEYFVHGDMCFAQSGQCYTSGLVFGNSSNRGKCMKPCRWPYELVDIETGAPRVTQMEGPHMLAVKDMCLLQQIPELIDSGIVSFKIEGRMRPRQYLAKVVRVYRTAIDRFLKDPNTYPCQPDLFEELYRERVRAFSTCVAFSKPDAGFIASTGEREPLFLSTGAKEQEIDLHGPAEQMGKDRPAAQNSRLPELAVHVNNLESAEAAMENDADWVYIGGEVRPEDARHLGIEALKRTIRAVHARKKKVGLLTPRVTLSHQLKTLSRTVFRLSAAPPDAILVHNLGSLHLVNLLTDIPIHADFSMNVINAQALELLNSLGIARATISLEASFNVVSALAVQSAMPLECMVHGPLPGMVAEHCLISMAMRNAAVHEPCRGICHHLNCGLKNKTGDVYPIIVDQYCRSHIMLSKDLACLGVLDQFLKTNVQCFRVEAQFYDPGLTGLITDLYARRIKNPAADMDSETLNRLIEKSPRGFGLGAYRTGIFKEKRNKYKTFKTDDQRNNPPSSINETLCM